MTLRFPRQRIETFSMDSFANVPEYAEQCRTMPHNIVTPFIHSLVARAIYQLDLVY